MCYTDSFIQYYFWLLLHFLSFQGHSQVEVTKRFLHYQCCKSEHETMICILNTVIPVKYLKISNFSQRKINEIGIKVVHLQPLITDVCVTPFKCR